MVDITVSLSNDKMLAYISGSIDEDISKEELLKRITNTLFENDILFGIQEKLVASVVNDLIENKRIEESIVAIGEYPKPEKLAGARFLVPTYLEVNLSPNFLEDITIPVHYHQLRDVIHGPYIVKENENIGKFRAGEKGETGHNVLGDAEGIQTKMQPPDELGQGLITQYDSLDIVCTLSGIIVRKKNHAYILPVNTDGAAKINVSKDRLKAYLHLFPPGPDGAEVTKNNVMKLLEQQKVTYGIKHDVIEEAIATVKKTGECINGECIAEGIPPIPGEDARVEYQVNLSFTHKPKIGKDGRADYYSIHLFENVDEKQTLAKILPPTDGTPGTDVYGEQIAATPGNTSQLALGKNVMTLPDDPTTLISEKTGHVYVRDENLFVEEVLKIETDVDFHTGNIDFVGDILIEGDIKSGFSVKAAGSVSVNGTIEDAIVEAGGSVIVHSGFIGKGKGRIKAGGDVVVKHVRNQTIMARNNIMIDGESLDANLFAGNEMFVEIKKSWIVGGVAVARNRVQAYAIGSSSHVPTEVAAGIDLFVKKILEELEKEIIDLENELNIIATNEKRLSEKKDLTEGELANERRAISRQLKRLRQEHEKKIAQLQKYKKHYKKSLYDNKGTVGVIDTIYPGVTVKIGNRKHRVNSAIKKSLFYVHEDTIRSQSFTFLPSDETEGN